MTSSSDTPAGDALALERAARILERRSLKQPPSILLRVTCRMMRRQAAAIKREALEARSG